jgi:hypothetical protein
MYETYRRVDAAASLASGLLGIVGTLREKNLHLSLTLQAF